MVFLLWKSKKTHTGQSIPQKFFTLSKKKRLENLQKYLLQKIFPPVCMLLVQFALINDFIPYDNWKVLFLTNAFCYYEILFNRHVFAFFEICNLKEVRMKLSHIILVKFSQLLCCPRIFWCSLQIKYFTNKLLWKHIFYNTIFIFL